MALTGLKKILSIITIVVVMVLTAIYYYVVGAPSFSDFLFKIVVVMPLFVMCIILVPLVIKTDKMIGTASTGASIGFIGGVLLISGALLWDLLTRASLKTLADNVGWWIYGFSLIMVIPATVLGAIIGFIAYILKDKLKKAKTREDEK